jgi:hypothetical protein
MMILFIAMPPWVAVLWKADNGFDFCDSDAMLRRILQVPIVPPEVAGWHHYVIEECTPPGKPLGVFPFCGALTALFLASIASAQMPAFPGAEGFAAQATGGRGGTVYHVSNLNDSGPGSFRDAVSAEKRFVVFDVGGYIALHSAVSVRSYITIAGQTAPGEGIATRDYEVSFSNSHNVICRYMRFRQGVTAGQEHKSAVGMHAAQQIILDHVSIEWGRWDNLDMTGSKDITIQYTIIGEGVSPQRFGCLCESDGVTFSHDLWISNHSRNPKAKGRIQFINNVVYNWELDAFIEGASKGDNWDDVIGNYFIKGPSTGSHGPFARGNEHAHVYAAGNLYAEDRDGTLKGKPVTADDLGTITPLDAPFAEAKVTIDPADKAYEAVAAGVGSSLHRDGVDTRIVADLTSLGKLGKIIKDPEDVGGFGKIAGGTAPLDSDGDGIPDEWEIAHHLDPHDASDAAKTNSDGYSNLEVYVNSVAK